MTKQRAWRYALLWLRVLGVFMTGWVAAINLERLLDLGHRYEASWGNIAIAIAVTTLWGGGLVRKGESVR